MTMLIQWAATSGVLILAVVLVRALLGRRMGAGLRYALWGLVLLRLLIPVQLFSVPVPEPVREALEHHQTQTAAPAPAYPAGDEVPGAVVLTPATQVPGAVQEDAPPAIHETPATPVVPARPFDWQGALGWLWLGGTAAMGLALIICNARFALDLRRRRRVVEAGCKLPVYAVEGLESPCLFGVVHPAVYLAPETAQNPVMLRHVLAHETTHARHGDQIWSLLRCAALAVHWWNPLVWLAAFLSRRDAELACDEGAIRLLGDGERKAYGWTLLTLVTAQPSPVSLMNAATTMSGGKKALWERVQRIAHAQKKAIWAAALAIALAVAVTACAFTSAAAPQEEQVESPEPVTSESPEPTAPGDDSLTAPDNSAALTAYQDILNGKAGFLFGEETRTVADIPTMFDVGDSSVRIQRYALADVDRDGEDEMVLCVCGAADDMEGYLILNREAGQVYGYELGFWGDIELRADGTYFGAYSSVDFGAYRLDSQGGEIFVAARVPNYDLNNSEPAYVVEGETVDRKTFEAAYQREKAKPEALWYDFTQENLDAILGGAGGGLAVVQTDLNRNGVPETLEVEEITDGKRLRVMENGYCIWSEDGYGAHGGWNTLFLCWTGGQDWLLRYNPYMSTGSADHSYTLFSLTDGWQQVKDGAVTGEVMVKQIGGMRFDTNFGQSMHEPMDTEAVAGFLGELSPLLEDAQPLMNTNPELEDLHERTGRWLTYPWDQYAPVGFAYDESKSMEDNLRAWEAAGDPLCTLPAPPDPAAQIMPFTGSLNLEFTSGVGAWRTDLALNADGTFTGQFNDSDMGVSGPGYQGTEYLSTFHGRFGDVEQVSEHVWSLTLEEITLDTGRPVGEEWIADGVRYISNAPYGLSAAGADAPPELGMAFMLYAPGAAPEEVDAGEEFYWWLHQGPLMNIPGWALHNLATDYGFLAR